MSLNTISKRSAALKFGLAYLAGTRPPSGLISRFDRAAILGCYIIATETGTPHDGWVFARQETTFVFARQETVWTTGE